MGQELIILYFSISREQPREVEFYALLSFLESCRIKWACRHVNIDDIAAHPHCGPLREIIGSLIYMHLPDLVYLNKIRPLLPILKHNHNLTILGGDPAIGIKAIEVLDTFRDVDIVVRAPESERVLAALVQACGGHRQWTTVEGITFRNPGDGHDIVSNENRPLAEDLDHLSSLGMAERGIFDSQWYPLITSRGCQYDCQYCGYQVPYRTDYQAENRYWRMKSHEKVVEEMAYLVAKEICRFVFHCHQFFNPGVTPDTGILAIAEEILNRKWQVAFRFSAKAGEIRKNQDSLFILRAAGLAEIDIGIDSGSRDFHQTYQTGSGVDDNIEVLAFLHRHGFPFDIGFIFYHPYLTADEIAENFAFLETIEEYFSHLKLPYSGYLDSRILNTVLILRHGMPIVSRLKKDGLIVESPGFSTQLTAGFLDSQVKGVYALHRAVNQAILPKIRHLFYDKTLVKQYDFINLFPLRLMQEIFKGVMENRFEDVKEGVSHMETFTQQIFAPHIEAICSDFSQYRNRDLFGWLKQEDRNK